MLVSGRVQFVLQVSKFGRCLSAGLLQTLLEKIEVDGNEHPKHFQRSTNSLPKVFQSCELQNPCPPLHTICARV